MWHALLLQRYLSWGLSLHQVGERPFLTPRTPHTGPNRQLLVLDEHSDDAFIRRLDEFWKGSRASRLFFSKSTTTRNNALHPGMLDGLVLLGLRLRADGDEALFNMWSEETASPGILKATQT